MRVAVLGCVSAPNVATLNAATPNVATPNTAIPECGHPNRSRHRTGKAVM